MLHVLGNGFSLSIKNIYTGMTQRDGMGREVEGGFRMGNTCKSMADSCQCMAKTTKYCKVISLQLIKIIGKKNIYSGDSYLTV